ncbi:MAG: helix-turn-helix domain-containing protein, partial [Desulfatirhabdiaceae bacterium]|nr:helix-turn-helix domain-containing protein [Desulfatirhabdiaceae bacterium]
LAGTEIRFLRKNMGVTGKRLSEIMGVDNATISRWERDFQKSAKAHDHFIRLLYITEKRVSADQATFDIEEVFSCNMSQKDKRQIRKIVYDHFEYIELLKGKTF